VILFYPQRTKREKKKNMGRFDSVCSLLSRTFYDNKESGWIDQSTGRSGNEWSKRREPCSPTGIRGEAPCTMRTNIDTRTSRYQRCSTAAQHSVFVLMAVVYHVTDSKSTPETKTDGQLNESHDPSGSLPSFTNLPLMEKTKFNIFIFLFQRETGGNRLGRGSKILGNGD
jgi:hypothetical protein